MSALLYLTEEELRKLFQEARRRNGYDFALLYCIYDLGLRSSEASVLRRDEINWQRRTLVVRVLKRSKKKTDKVTGIVEERKPPPPVHCNMSLELTLVLKDHCSKVSSDTWVFPHKKESSKPIDRSAIKYIYFKYAHKIGLGPNREWHPHLLRHTKGTIKAQQLTAKGIGALEQIKELKDTLRHADDKTCLQYIHASSKAREVSRQVDEEMASSLMKSLLEDK